jgi:hypothetical protein
MPPLAAGPATAARADGSGNEGGGRCGGFVAAAGAPGVVWVRHEGGGLKVNYGKSNLIPINIEAG